MFRIMNRQSKKGFTLIEIMIVIAIIGLLSVVLVPKVLPLKNQAKDNGVQANVYIIRSFLENRAGTDGIKIASLLAASSGGTSIASILKTIQSDIGVKMNTTFSGSSAVKNPFNNSTTITYNNQNIQNNNPGSSSVVIGYDADNVLPTNVSSITSTITTPGVTAVIVYKTGYVVYGIDNFGVILEPTLIIMPVRVAQVPVITNPPVPSVPTTTPPSTIVTTPINLGTAGNYAILTKAGITNVPTSVITGNIGVSPIAAGGITGFSLTADATNVFSRSAQVSGKVYAADYVSPTPSNLTTAVSSMEAAYTDAAGRTPNYTEMYTGDISGKTLTAGVYKWGTGVLISNDVTLSGGADDVFIFQIAKGITQAVGTKIILSGGVQAKNIFWQVAEAITINTSAHFEGTILCKTSIAMGSDASVNGRLLAQTAVTLIKNTITAPTVVDPVSLNVDRVYNFLAINAAEKIIIGGGNGQIYEQLQGNLYSELSGYFSSNPIINTVNASYKNIVYLSGNSITEGMSYSVFACQTPEIGKLDYSKYPGVVVVYPLINDPIGYCIYGISSDGTKIGERKLTLSSLMNATTESNLSDNVNLVADYLQKRVSADIINCKRDNSFFTLVDSSTLANDMRAYFTGTRVKMNAYVNKWNSVQATTSPDFNRGGSILLTRVSDTKFSLFKGSIIVYAVIDNVSTYNALLRYEVYGINYNGVVVGYRKVE